MEHVSTLCAVSTVGIAATGFALGRVDRDSPKPRRSRKKTFPFYNQCAHATESPISSLSDPIQPGILQSSMREKGQTLNTKLSDQVNTDGVSGGDRSDGSNSRRKSSLAGIILRRRGQTLSNLPLRVEEDSSTASHSRRPSSSWMRRKSFQPDRRSSCQSPQSPSFRDSTSPMFRPSSQRRAPNKLVKRPPSQHLAVHPLFTQGTSSPLTPALRRPATSYQRSEYLRHKGTNSLNFEPGLVTEATARLYVKGPTDSGVWQPYLNADPNTSNRLNRKFSTATKPKDQGLRRIVPEAEVFPALLLATSITNEERAEANLEKSTSVSPVQFRNPFRPTDTSSQEIKACFPPDAKDIQSPVSSEADPKSPACPPDSAGDINFGVTSFTHRKRRAISTPLPSLTKPEGTHFGFPRPYERRNITDPSSVFCHPQAITRADSLIPLASSTRRGPLHSLSISRVNIGYSREIRQRPFSSSTVDSSTFQGLIRQRPKRHSIAASDPASTIIGSDDTRIFSSGDEDETDFFSDTAFDSIRTHITSSSSGLHAAQIENIFDQDTPCAYADEESMGHKNPGLTHTIVSRTMKECHYSVHANATSIPISSPESQDVIRLQEDSRLSFQSELTDDDDALSLVAALPGEETSTQNSQSIHPSLSMSGYRGGYSESRRFLTDNTPQISDCLADAWIVPRETLESCPRINIFDWSEQRNDREGSGSDGRPRTVHGKHGAESRGSRPPGRKAPNTLHLRSQSVPVSRDPPTANETRQTSGKFGTWGLGSKGVSEDWDSDFEFEDADVSAVNGSMKPTRDHDVPRRSMIVPQAIMDRQASLHGQFGQVQELTLLVEELKRLRHQASFLDIARGPSSELWKEAEGIVKLATLDEDTNHSPPGSPSSLTFSFDDSEVESSNNENRKRASRESWQPSLSEQSNPTQPTRPNDRKIPAEANSVLDLIYQQRASSDSSESHFPRPKKLPFDTRSLRDLVVRAGVVTRALKEVIRKAEGVAIDSSNTFHTPGPSFSQIFNQPSNENLTSFGACYGA